MTGWAAEGSIDIELILTTGMITEVRITNRRPLGATAVLAGRPAAEVPELVSRLFSVCRIAQGIAAARAMEAACGKPADAAQETARQVLLLGETVLEHATRAVFDWPMLLGEAPAAGEVKALRGALTNLHRVLYPDGDWMCPGGGRLAPDLQALAERLATVGAVLDRAVFGGASGFDGPERDDWARQGRTAAARLFARLAAGGLEGFGASEAAPLPVLSAPALNARMAADRDGSFLALPEWTGTVHHTGPLARQADSRAVARALAEHGCGVLAHGTARLVELVLSLREMRDFCGTLCEHDGVPTAPAEGCGLAIVEAARGRLVHRAEVQEGNVTRYQILAPTEWNFRPDGALARGLIGRPGGDDPAWRARLLVTALDPCVAFSLRVS